MGFVMQHTEILVRHISSSEMIAYQMVSSEAVTLRCDEYPDAYSILVLRIEDGVVTESEIIYDVSRDPRKCLWVIDMMLKKRAVPMNAADIAESVL